MPGRETALVIGAISRDLDAAHPAARETAGGVVHHAGLALARLGTRPRVVTRVRPDDDRLLGPLRSAGVEVVAHPSRRTTTYRNDYSGLSDAHELCAVSDTLHAADIPSDWRSADLIQLGPLHRRDLDPELPQQLDGRIGIDIQGLVRLPGPALLAPYPKLEVLLDRVQVLQASESELPSLLAGDTVERFVRRHGIEEMIVTLGARGSVLLHRGRRLEVPALEVAGRHPVGAGDVFLASYLVARARSSSPMDAARFATRICAAKIDTGELPEDPSA
ncbi:MAG: PfkB family carbohydrate kinase [Myxococcota bacterium]